MENITCELNGIKYLMVELLITEDNKNRREAICTKYECIYKGIKEIEKGGFFSEGYAIITVLVPEKNIIAFNKEGLK